MNLVRSIAAYITYLWYRKKFQKMLKIIILYWCNFPVSFGNKRHKNTMSGSVRIIEKWLFNVLNKDNGVLLNKDLLKSRVGFKRIITLGGIFLISSEISFWKKFKIIFN